MASYWCHGCNSFVRVRSPDTIDCLDCGGGFVEEVDTHHHRSHHRLITEVYPDPPVPRTRRNLRYDRSHFNPVIVLRNPNPSPDGGDNYELYYEDSTGLGLLPLPDGMWDFLIGSGFNRVIDQLIQLEGTEVGVGRVDNPPASKSAIESLPTIRIDGTHVATDSHCAVCKEPFQLRSKARELPCHHIYHNGCILPWLSANCTCPVCRYALPADDDVYGRNLSELEEGESDGSNVGLMIWRLPGGGFAVGRFAGGRGAAEPAVFTEMDGGFNSGGAPRRIEWSGSERIVHVRSRVRRAFRNLASLFGRFRRISPPRFSVEIGFRSHSYSVSSSRSSRRNSRHWTMAYG